MNSETYDLTINIDNGDSDPVQQATVTLNGIDKTTNNSGEVSFTNVAVSGGDINCYITCNGYEPKTETLTVDETHTSFTISLNPITYSFTSYEDEGKTSEMDTGTVQATGVGTAKWVQVEILTCEEYTDWIDTTVYVTRDAVADGETTYRLYSGAGTGALDYYVTISPSE